MIVLKKYREQYEGFCEEDSVFGDMYRMEDVDPLLEELEQLREEKRLREFWHSEKIKNDNKFK